MDDRKANAMTTFDETSFDDDVTLFERDPRYIPRVAAVHDMCGYGKCSLTAAIPILSAAGCDVCPVPTALFSAHTMFKDYTFNDTTAMLPAYLDAWRKEGVELDGVYSGFLGSAEQVALIQRLYREYPKALRLVDPVMGDGGRMYPTYTEELCRATAELARGADVLMPNLTEASLLTGREYPGRNLSEDEARDWLDALLDLGARNVVLKGIDRGDGMLRNYVANAETGGEGAIELTHEKLPYMIHGTGDAFASALCGAVMAGLGLARSAYIAGQFVRSAMRHTRDQPHFEERGVSFELSLGELTGLVDQAR
ncbi:pyridoxamine kinase [Bifidobacterium simiarum]|uniref:pyridoxamine kinase n=1 Tax=Bifidobacterium simiarum TaxID=2045441 RepID=UPI003B8A8803